MTPRRQSLRTMLSEGSIIQNLMLTRLLSRTPLACLFQSIDVDTGERYLVKVARSEWLDLPGTIQSLGFDFRPGQALPWRPLPEEIIQTETELLKELHTEELAVPKPLLVDQVDDVVFCVYRFFDGITLDEAFESGSGFTIPILINLLEEVDKLKVCGLFHGNLQPSSILISSDEVLLTDLSYPATVISGRTKKRLLRCITVPEFYPLLDPRHDELAMGILLYTLVTGKHPLALEAIARQLDLERRCGPKLSAILDDARERGANRFLSPLLSFVNPVDVKGPASKDFEELVLKTLGFGRTILDGQEVLEVMPDSWLDNLASGSKKAREDTWTLADAADALAQVFNAGDAETAGSCGKASKKKKVRAHQSGGKEAKEGESSAESISFAPEDNEPEIGETAGGNQSDLKRLEPTEIIFEDTILPASAQEMQVEDIEEDAGTSGNERSKESQTEGAEAADFQSSGREDEATDAQLSSGAEEAAEEENAYLSTGERENEAETREETAKHVDEDSELAAVSELLADSITSASEPGNDSTDKPAKEK